MKTCLPSINYFFLLQQFKPCPAATGKHALHMDHPTKPESFYNPIEAGDSAASTLSEINGGPTQSPVTAAYSINTVAKENFTQYAVQNSLKKALISHAVYPNVATIDMCKGKVFALAISDGLLYTASDSKEIRVFQTPLFEEVDCFGSASAAAQSLMAFDGVVYSAHEDNKIRVWHRVRGGAVRNDLCKHKLVTVLPRLEHCMKSMLSKRNYVQVRRHKSKLWIEHADRISALALGSCGRGTDHDVNASWCTPPSVLYSASWDKTVKVWSLKNFKCMESLHAHHDAVNAMVVIDGSVLVTASADCTIKIWAKKRKAKRHVLVNTLEGHKAAVNALAVSKNSKVLYSGGADGTLIAWKQVLCRRCKTVQGVTIRPTASNKVSISGSSSAELRTQSGSRLSRGRSITKQSSLSSTTSSGNLSGEVLSNCSLGTTLSSSLSGEIITRDNSVTNHRLRTMISSAKCREASTNLNFVKKAALVGHTRAILSVSTVDDNYAVCSSSTDKTIRVWRRRDKEKGTWVYACMAVLSGHGGPVKAIASVQCSGGHKLEVYGAGHPSSAKVSAQHAHALIMHGPAGAGAITAASGSCTYEHGEEDDDGSSIGRNSRATYNAHAPQDDDQRSSDGHEASTSALADEEEEGGCERIIVYSAGLDSKVKMWALNIPR